MLFFTQRSIIYHIGLCSSVQSPFTPVACKDVCRAVNGQTMSCKQSFNKMHNETLNCSSNGSRPDCIISKKVQNTKTPNQPAKMHKPLSKLTRFYLLLHCLQCTRRLRNEGSSLNRSIFPVGRFLIPSEDKKVRCKVHTAQFIASGNLQQREGEAMTWRVSRPQDHSQHLVLQRKM